MPIKNQPYSKDPRDPYWASRIATPEAGELLAAKLDEICSILVNEFFYAKIIALAATDEQMPIHLPNYGLWKLVHVSFGYDTTGCGVQEAILIGDFNLPSNGFWVSRAQAAGELRDHSYYSYSDVTDGEVTTDYMRGPTPDLIYRPGDYLAAGKVGDGNGVVANLKTIWLKIALNIPETSKD